MRHSLFSDEYCSYKMVLVTSIWFNSNVLNQQYSVATFMMKELTSRERPKSATPGMAQNN